MTGAAFRSGRLFPLSPGSCRGPSRPRDGGGFRGGNHRFVHARCPPCRGPRRAAQSGGHQLHHDASERHSSHDYDDQYIFGLTHGIAEAEMHPVAKVLVFPITVPLDFVLLPFEVIGGLF